MNAAAFANAAIPAEAQVLGLALRPYSIGHELWLTKCNNLAHPSSGADAENAVASLPLAALICASSWTSFAQFGQGWRHKLKMWRWRRGLKRMAQLKPIEFAAYANAELLAFQKYVIEGSRSFVVNLPSGDGTKGRTLGSPMMLILHQFINTLPDREIKLYGETAWDYPYALAQMRYAANAELTGRLEVENEAEYQTRLAAEEWERAHPESTLKYVNKENNG